MGLALLTGKGGLVCSGSMVSSCCRRAAVVKVASCFTAAVSLCNSCPQGQILVLQGDARCCVLQRDAVVGHA